VMDVTGIMQVVGRDERRQTCDEEKKISGEELHVVKERGVMEMILFSRLVVIWLFINICATWYSTAIALTEC
jgi:hypothetical protein